MKRLGSLILSLLLLIAPAAAVEQSSFVMPVVGPMSMATFAGTYLNPALRAIQACNWGTSAPANGVGAAPIAYECWADTTTSPIILFKRYDGASWVTIGSLNASTHAWVPYMTSGVSGAVPYFSSTGIPSSSALLAQYGLMVGGGAGAAPATITACTVDQVVFGQSSANPICRTVSGDVTFASGVSAIGTAKVVYAMMQNVAALSVIGRSANSSGVPAAISCVAASDAVLRESGSVIGCGTVATAGITNNAITDAKLRQSAALSLIGRSANSTGNVADISASAASDCIYRESSSTIGCGTITTAGIAASAITNAKLANMAANTLKANATGGSAAPSDVAPASARSSSLLNIDAITTHGDSIYSIAATDRVIATSAAFTASRAWTLPAANAVNPGQAMLIVDLAGGVTGVNTLVITRAGSDTINGGPTATISAANGAYYLVSDGTSKWTAQSMGAASGGGVTSVACGTGLDGGTITTSGTCSLSAARRTARTVQKFLTSSTSGTYTTPANVLSIDIIMVGAGGGGQGSGAPTVGNGTAGGNVCWNTSGAACTTPVYQVSSGAGGAGAAAAGGVVSGSGTCDIAVAGGSGSGSTSTVGAFHGSPGGSSALGGNGGGGTPGNNGGSGQANTGGGGGGGSSNGTGITGAGGGAGAYCVVRISAPAASYTYAIGAAGSAGTAGSSGFAGGNGGTGGIWVFENYNN
jgi:hypothetical protein